MLPKRSHHGGHGGHGGLTASGRRLARDRRPDLVSVLSVSSVVQSFLCRFRLDGRLGGEGEGEGVDQTFGDGAGLRAELGDGQVVSTVRSWTRPAGAPVTLAARVA